MIGSKQLRQDLRRLRRNLSPDEQRTNSLSISRRLACADVFKHSQRIAFYLSADGEIDLSPLLNRAWTTGKQCFLPILRSHPTPSLWFAEFRSGDKLIHNRFGIQEPLFRKPSLTMPWGLNLILMPLVGFDLRGNRLGMGGGYYDRTLAYLRHRRCWKTPKLIGVAHECQKIAELTARPWDIPLNAAVTEKAFYPFTRQADVSQPLL